MGAGFSLGETGAYAFAELLTADNTFQPKLPQMKAVFSDLT